MSGPLLLSIDNGTQSVRALVFDTQGELQYKHKIPVEPYFSPQPGWAEQHLNVYWEALCLACQNVVQTLGKDAKRLGAAAVTTQRGTVVNLDAHGEPLRPAITWLDQRRSDSFPPMGGGYDQLLGLLGQSRAIHYFRAQAESNWIQQHQPEVWERTAKFLLLSGYLNYRLCGEYVDSTASQVAYIPFDYRRHRWASAYDWKWRATRISPTQLPRLVPPATVMGRISPSAAALTGLPRGLPLVAAAADKACEVLGSGCISPDYAAISYGTTATVNVCGTRYVEPAPALPPYPAAIPGAYCCEVQNFRGFWLVEWFLAQFGLEERMQAEQTGTPAEQLLDRLIDETPPGAMGLVLQPYWTPGIKFPGPEAKGAIVGFGDVHTRAHVYRAIVEGLAYALRQGKERVERRQRVRVERLRVSGGGSQSDRVMQITADAFGLPAERPHTFETSGLGAAIDSAVALGAYPDFAAAGAAMTRIRDRFEPIAANTRLYDQLYRSVYQRLYSRLSSVYSNIRRITGYPDATGN